MSTSKNSRKRSSSSEDRRPLVGEAGERFALWWLSTQGLTPIARNVAVDGGEIDLLMADHGTRVAVEVRTVNGEGDPIDAIGHQKRRHVARLAGRVRAGRIDLLGIGFRPSGVEVHWVPG